MGINNNTFSLKVVVRIEAAKEWHGVWHIFMHHTLSAYYMPGTFLGTGDIAKSETKKVLTLMSLTFPGGDRQLKTMLK